MSKLIVLSNRISMPSGKASAGGLAVAVQDALNDSNGAGMVSKLPILKRLNSIRHILMGSTILPALLHISNMHSTTVVLPIKYYGLPCMIGMT